MGLEALAVATRENSFEVVGDQFDSLLTDDVVSP
jgi:hypothetical protein